jgi:hypothetical protein
VRHAFVAGIALATIVIVVIRLHFALKDTTLVD